MVVPGSIFLFPSVDGLKIVWVIVGVSVGEVGLPRTAVVEIKRVVLSGEMTILVSHSSLKVISGQNSRRFQLALLVSGCSSLMVSSMAEAEHFVIEILALEGGKCPFWKFLVEVEEALSSDLLEEAAWTPGFGLEKCCCHYRSLLDLQPLVHHPVLPL